MSLESYLENLRGKPEHIRKRYAFWGSLGITAIIFVFWLGSFSSFGLGDKARNTVATAVDKAGTPAQSLTASVGSFFNDIKDIIFSPQKATYSSVEVKAGKK